MRTNLDAHTPIRRLLRRARRLLAAAAVLLVPPGLAYTAWQPGTELSDGRHDLGRNAAWLQHGWLGDDGWFTRNGGEARKPQFRSDAAVRRLVATLAAHRVADVFPHLCPAGVDGAIPTVDAEQTRRFLRLAPGLRVMPWVGGVLGVHARIEDPRWRDRFVGSVVELLETWPQLAGVHLNIEPMPSGNPSFLRLLEELRGSLPDGRVLSVAAYPPPTRLHPFPEVHWEQPYFRAVAARSDQLAVMMYDTALPLPKLYAWLMGSWTRQVIAWSGSTSVLLGLPAYEDEGVGYHDPKVENLATGLAGVHAGLESLPDRGAYQGLALYSEWTMEEAEWALLRRSFLLRGPEGARAE